jgi:glycosyltransferase involved in cell wall biosynthesis
LKDRPTTLPRALQFLLADRIDQLSPGLRDLLFWHSRPPRDAWHSFDSTPWRHPWLSLDNLQSMKAFSARLRSEAQAQLERIPRGDWTGSYGFVGNIANAMYLRAKGLRRAGIAIDVIGAPGDNFVMSQAGWEEFDGDIDGLALDCAELWSRLPQVDRFFVFEPITEWPNMRLRQFPNFVRLSDFARWPDYLSQLPTLEKLQQYGALLTTQVPYLAYLSGRPYLVAQCGGDLWYECARDDALGRLQRAAFHHANAFLVSNPWSFAHARRYGMRHLVYLPLILDQDTYCPGNGVVREQWQAQSGGNFFVLSTARVDQFYKGSGVGLEGFAIFSREHAGARLVQMGWGNDFEPMRQRLVELGIADCTIILPVAGKRRIISYLRSADCLLDQFRLGYFGATGLEAMACGLPAIMRLERDQYEALCETGAPPVLDASTPGEVCMQLRRLSSDNEWAALVRQQHRDWFVRNHGSAQWWPSYFAMLLLTARGHRFRFNGSPLCAPLDQEEREYHAAELAKAPPFPNYS